MSTDSQVYLQIQTLLQGVQRLNLAEHQDSLPGMEATELANLASVLDQLAQEIIRRDQQEKKLEQIIDHIAAGFMLDEILEMVYQEFHELIPYNRIGVALLEQDGAVLRSRWAQTDQDSILLNTGYSAPIAGSSLEAILQTGQPRIINDLVEYLKNKPQSKSTRLIVQEGMRSSLTCPLVVNGAPVGFIFFSKTEPNAYAEAHSDIYQRIAGRLSILVERGRMVTDLAGQKLEIERQNEELRRLSVFKDIFLGVAAHDLRSPLSYILTAVAMLQDTDNEIYSSSTPELLQGIARQSKRMLGLISDLLDLTEIEQGGLKLNLSSLDLNELLIDCMRTLEPAAAEKSSRIELDSQTGQYVMADENRLRQVVENLVTNAIKYSPPSSLIRLSSVSMGNAWRISVQDQGPGILSEDREKLFRAFSRLSNVPTAGEKGIGLGLAIARWIVDAHDGQVGVDSQPGHGATFWFTIPAESGKHKPIVPA